MTNTAKNRAYKSGVGQQHSSMSIQRKIDSTPLQERQPNVDDEVITNQAIDNDSERSNYLVLVEIDVSCRGKEKINRFMNDIERQVAHEFHERSNNDFDDNQTKSSDKSEDFEGGNVHGSRKKCEEIQKRDADKYGDGENLPIAAPVDEILEDGSIMMVDGSVSNEFSKKFRFNLL